MNELQQYPDDSYFSAYPGFSSLKEGKSYVQELWDEYVLSLVEVE